jgi:putative transposase
MEGTSWPLDALCVERLWRSVKDMEVFPHDEASPREASPREASPREASPREARAGLLRYLAFSHRERLHQALNYQTPATVYFQPISTEEASGQLGSRVHSHARRRLLP